MLDTTQLLLAVNAALFAILWWSVRGWINGVNKKLDKVNDCVTWADLDKELGPIKAGQVNHGERLVAIETTCKQEHGK